MSETEVIFFETRDDIRLRKRYLETLRCAKHDLDRIIGKYAFSKINELPCGLNGCNQPHQYGYVIRLRDGRETHCGQVCGAREFDGVKWTQVEARFRRAADAKVRRETLRKVLEARAPLLANALELEGALKAATDRISKVFGELSHDPPLEVALNRCLHDGGRIQVENRTEEDVRVSMGSAHAGRRFHTVDTIGGSEAAKYYRQILGEFRGTVVVFLQQLDSGSLGNMTDKQLEKISRDLDDVAPKIAGAHTFARAAERFCAPDNLAKLWTLRLTMSKRDVTSRTERVLRRVTGTIAPDDYLVA